jgi:hypothetical protein
VCFRPSVILPFGFPSDSHKSLDGSNIRPRPGPVVRIGLVAAVIVGWSEEG